MLPCFCEKCGVELDLFDSYRCPICLRNLCEGCRKKVDENHVVCAEGECYKIWEAIMKGEMKWKDIPKHLRNCKKGSTCIYLAP